VASPNGTSHPRAARRRVERNTPTLGAGAAGDDLAKVIGESVALHLGQLLGPILPQLAQLAQVLPQLRPQGTACLPCAVEAKQALAAYTIACEVAQKAAEPVPDPPAPPIQQAFTWMPVQTAAEVPAVAVPVCFDHLQQLGPAPRPVGLVLPDGRPVVAQAG
jgi:hypothetical protein